MKRSRVILLLLFSFLLLDHNASAVDAELYGQVLYRYGGPASYVDVVFEKEKSPIDKIKTDRSGFYSIKLPPGEYTLKVEGGKGKMIFLSPRGTRVDFRISKD